MLDGQDLGVWCSVWSTAGDQTEKNDQDLGRAAANTGAEK